MEETTMRGLYSQNEGNESRSNRDILGDRIADNQIVEGDYVAALRNHAAAGKWDHFSAAVAELRREGFDRYRIDSMTVRAMAGLKF
jgi:hypothetical protein